MSDFDKHVEGINEIINEIEEFVDDDLIAKPVDTVCKTMYRVRDCADTLKYLVKRINAVNTRMKEEIVPKKFEEQGVSSIVVEGYRYVVMTNTRASVIADQKVDAYAWLRSNRLGDLITETVNASTLSATAKSLLEEGSELPDDMFRTYMLPNTSITKVKGKS